MPGSAGRGIGDGEVGPGLGQQRVLEDDLAGDGVDVVGVQGVEDRRHVVVGDDRAGLAEEVDPGVDVDALFLDVDDEGVQLGPVDQVEEAVEIVPVVHGRVEVDRLGRELIWGSIGRAGESRAQSRGRRQGPFRRAPAAPGAERRSDPHLLPNRCPPGRSPYPCASVFYRSSVARRAAQPRPTAIECTSAGERGGFSARGDSQRARDANRVLNIARPSSDSPLPAPRLLVSLAPARSILSGCRAGGRRRRSPPLRGRRRPGRGEMALAVSRQARRDCRRALRRPAPRRWQDRRC